MFQNLKQTISACAASWSELKHKEGLSGKCWKTIAKTSRSTLIFLVTALFTIISIVALRTQIADQLNNSRLLAQVNGELQSSSANQIGNWVTTELRSMTSSSSDDEDQSFLMAERQKQWVASWISKRYRVADEAVDIFVSAAYLTANEIELDPLLILAVMAIESRFNPFAESPVGAKGLMQVMSKVHSEKFADLGGIEAALDPVTNIKVGSMILKEYVTRGGSVEKGLKSYVGAAAHTSDSGYGAKVLAEYRKLKAVASGKKVSTLTAAKPSIQKKTVRKSDTSKQNSESNIHDDESLNFSPLNQL